LIRGGGICAAAGPVSAAFTSSADNSLPVCPTVTSFKAL
jgi:hypothetical protein